ncbi:hypothetical protein BO71DRAFT_450976 [Aspergillus ellipticus CBS 707.79]|uniref:Choline transport protein n=1 Tax=Aspergillus ellipticus CBS 707.79 TaxID=1448320 RepID=A0A319DP79_9EURO|nr:hypothetical protein BO71DRAFT_450976 [Aspergillus ellipticus CBS 707.79]
MGYTQDMQRNVSGLSLLGVAFSLANSWFGISASLITGINSGGQYFWASELAPRQMASLASYLTGCLAWAGAIFTSASVALSLGSAGVGMWQLSHPDLFLNFFAFLFNCVGKLLPTVATTSLYISLISFAVILITVPAAAPTHASHPEVSHPERSIPIAILCTVLIGFVTSWTYCITMFFSVSNLEEILGSPTGVPILALFYQALQNKAGAIVLETLILVTGIGCQIACYTWQSRLCWSFARDRGLPAPRFLAKIHPTLDIPLHAHSVSCFIVGLLGLLYLGSSAAFNSMVTACIVLLYASYAVPVVCIKHGPFWLGGVGLACNIVLLLWTLFCLVIYSFPSVYPVTASNMNYVSAVYGVVAVIIALDWVLRGRRVFRGQTARLMEIEAGVVRK